MCLTIGLPSGLADGYWKIWVMVSACSDFSALSYSNKRGEKSTETPYALKQGGPTTRVRPWWLEGKSLLILAASSMNKKMFIYANQVHCNVCCGEKKKKQNRKKDNYIKKKIKMLLCRSTGHDWGPSEAAPGGCCARDAQQRGGSQRRRSRPSPARAQPRPAPAAVTSRSWERARARARPCERRGRGRCGVCAGGCGAGLGGVSGIPARCRRVPVRAARGMRMPVRAPRLCSVPARNGAAVPWACGASQAVRKQGLWFLIAVQPPDCEASGFAGMPARSRDLHPAFWYPLWRKGLLNVCPHQRRVSAP